MDRHRRRILAALGAGAVGALAGCPSSGADSSSATHQAAKLVPSDGDEHDLFGGSVAVSGAATTALIGAPGEDPNGRDAGSAYVFTESDGSWHQQAKLAPDDEEDGHRFGESVAMSGDGNTALVGTKTAGSAYVFTASGGGWHQQATLVPDDGDGGDRFGESVSVSALGSTALIGAHRDADPNGRWAGAAYVFAESDGSWHQQAKLVPDDGDEDDFFGWSLAVSGDGSTAIIGAHRDEDPNGEAAGSAYVFANSDGSWHQQAKLVPDDGDDNDQFGSSVAMSDDGATAIIGAQREEDPNGEDAGSAYVFANSDGSWHQQAKLVPDDGDEDDWFGSAVAVSGRGRIALIGADVDEDPNGTRAGSAYVFANSDGSWHQQAKLAPDDGDAEDHFGWSVSNSRIGTTILIGAERDEDPNGNMAGSAYVFSLESAP